jgi:Ion channel
MSDMPREPEPDRDDDPASNGAPPPSGPRRTITVDLDGDLDERLSWIALSEKTSKEGLLARIIESQPRRSGQHSRTVEVTEVAAERLAAAAATIGMSEEEFIAEAIDTYSPRMRARAWLGLGVPGVLLILPVALMFLSPRFGPAAPVLAWVIFGVAMLAAGLGVLFLVTTAMYAEWMVMKFRVTGLIAQAACGTAAMLSVFAYAYWILSSQVPSSFNLPMARIDAVYFTLGTFTTTGTGQFSARSGGAELLVCGQVVLGWTFVAVLVALLVPRAAAAYKRQSTNGRIIVRVEKPER